MIDGVVTLDGPSVFSKTLDSSARYDDSVDISSCGCVVDSCIIAWVASPKPARSSMTGN